VLTGGVLTSPKNLKFEKKSHDHERIFIEHYDWLLDWARQITRGTREEAEDLVQDLYVRFVQMKTTPDLPDEGHIRSYLYKALKNMFISRKLRHGRDAVSGLSVVDFDSVEFAMASVDRSKLLYVRSDLAAICEYVILRRSTSKAAVAFALRFFFGYLPTEAAALLRTNRVAFEALIQAGRLEARAFLERPGVLRFLDRRDKKAPSFPRYLPEDSNALFAELQRRLFSEREGDCASLEELEQRYTDRSPAPVSTEEAAHLASCRLCLGRASQLLGLPDLTLQFSPDPELSGDMQPPSAGSESTDFKKLRRKLRETFEHRPKKLQLAVDGEVRGVQSITGSVSKFQIKLQPLSTPSFVEVLSEQGVGLLYLDLQETPEVPTVQQAQVELSDDRSLTVSLNLVDGVPVIDVTYYDPLVDLEIDQTPTASAPSMSANLTLPARTKVSEQFALGSLPLLNRLRRLWHLKFALAIAVSPILFLISGLHLHRAKIAPAIAAPTLLAQSREKSLQAIPLDGAEHRTFSVEIRSKGGHHVETGRVDSLRAARSSRSAIRLLSGTGKLLAGRWTDAAGKVSRYQSTDAPPKTGLAATGFSPVDGIWMHPPDAADFEALAGDSGSLLLSTTKDGYDISFTRDAMADRATVTEAHLVLAAESLHPIVEELRVQQGAEQQDCRFRELTYDLLRPDQVHEQDFLPAAAQAIRGQSFIPHLDRSAEQVHLALNVLELLSNAGEEIDQSVDFERRSDGSVELNGVISSAFQKYRLIHALHSLNGSDKLRLDLHSVDEPSRNVQTGPVKIEVLQPVAVGAEEHPPFDDMIRSVYTARDYTGLDLEQKIREAENELVRRGAELRRATWQVGNIGALAFTPREIEVMTLDEKERWLSLLRHHLQSCRTARTAIETMLSTQPNEQPGNPPESASAAIGNLAELTPSVVALSHTGERLDRLLITGFTFSPNRPTVVLDSGELLPLLTELDHEESRLSRTIERLQQSIHIRSTE
jgi:DNA-directed RNA polymerase specialized sigma24 family protein